MHEKGPNKALIGDNYGFLLLTPVGTSKGLEDVDTGWSPGDYTFDMGIELEVWVKCHSYYAESPFKK